MFLLTRSDTAMEIEILVRHQLAVLQRRTPRSRMCWSDRTLTAALTRMLSTRRRLGLLVTPATILRWHRRLVAQRWSTRPASPGRPAIPAGVRALAVRLATENPTRGYRRIHGEPRLPDRRLHHLDDPEERRHRPLTPTSWTHLARNPADPGPRDPGLRCVSSTPSPCGGSARSSSSSTPPAGYTSSGSPPTRPERG
jgi:hypothetical protein